MTRKISITFTINGKTKARDSVFNEELKRSRVAYKKLGLHHFPNDLVTARQALVNRKLELGHSRLKEICASDIRKSQFGTRLFKTLSLGKVKPCQIKIKADGLSAKDFIQWFEQVNAISDEASLLAARPEHYIIDSQNNQQEVYETTGGSPFISGFIIDFKNQDNFKNNVLADYPYKICGTAVTNKGKKIGGAIHQFKDTPTGMEGILTINYPYLTPKHMIEGHKIHLAIEFANWIEFASNTLN